VRLFHRQRLSQAEKAGLRALALGVAISCDNAMEGVGKQRPRPSRWPVLASIGAWLLVAVIVVGLLALGARAGVSTHEFNTQVTQQ
jgi:hypothetical protein